MLVGASPRRVAIVGGARIPFARGNGAYAQVGNQEMLIAALRAVVERFGLQGQRMGRGTAGPGIKNSESMNFAGRFGPGPRPPLGDPGPGLAGRRGTSLEA